VRESVEEYKVYTSRFDAVEQALEEALGGVGIAVPSAAGPEPVSRQSKPRPQESGGTPEDDVPF